MIRLCITDDHPLIMEGLRMIFQQQADIEVIGTCSNSKELFEWLEEDNRPDIILMDINMPGMNGIEACGQVMRLYPGIRVIGLSMLAESHLIRLMLRNGAVGFLHKNAGPDEIVNALVEVMKGNTYFSQEVSAVLLATGNNHQRVSNAPFPKLSNREQEVLKMILNEKTTQEIADALFISFGTVETHRRNIMMKLGVRNTAGLVRVAIEYQLGNNDGS